MNYQNVWYINYGSDLTYEVRYIKNKNTPRFQYIKYMNIGEERLPVPYRKGTIHEFRTAFSDATPTHVEYRKIIIRKVKMSAKIFYFHSEAFAMVFDGKSHMNKDEHLVYNKPILYYRIGCEHNYTELTTEQCTERNLVHLGSQCHVYLCGKCKIIKFDRLG